MPNLSWRQASWPGGEPREPYYSNSAALKLGGAFFNGQQGCIGGESSSQTPCCFWQIPHSVYFLPLVPVSFLCCLLSLLALCKHILPQPADTVEAHGLFIIHSPNSPPVLIVVFWNLYILNNCYIDQNVIILLQ